MPVQLRLGPPGRRLWERMKANVVASQRSPARTWTGFLLAWGILALILAAPAPDGLSAAGKATLAVMSWSCVMWVFEAMPVGVSGIAIPMLLVTTGAAAPFPKAASGFSTPVVFLCLSAFLFAAIMQAAGLDRRIALSLLHRMRVTTVNGVIWAMFAVNMVLSLIIPAANARAATLLPVVSGVSSFFGDSEREANGKRAIVIQTLVYGSMISGMCIMTAHLPNMVLVGLFDSQLGVHLSYVDWFKLQWPYLGMFVLTQWWVKTFFNTRGVSIDGGIRVIERQYAELPRTSATEWMVLAVFAIVAILWMTEDIHKIKSHLSAIIGLTILFVPGLFGFSWKEIQDRTIWGTLMLLAGALSMSAAMEASGLAMWLSDLVHPVAAGHGWMGVLAILMAGTHIIRLGMLSNIAAITMLAPVLLALAPRLGLHPVALTMLVSDTDTFAYILPTQITAAVIAYSTGTFTMAQYARVGVVSVLIAIAYGIFVMAPWYAFLGVPLWNASAPWPF